MGEKLFPLRSIPLTRKRAVPLSFLAPLTLMGRPLLPLRVGPPFTPQPPLIRDSLLSYQSLPSSHLFHPHHHLINFHLFFPLPRALTHFPLHHQTSHTLRLPLPPFLWELSTLPLLHQVICVWSMAILLANLATFEES